MRSARYVYIRHVRNMRKKNIDNKVTLTFAHLHRGCSTRKEFVPSGYNSYFGSDSRAKIFKTFPGCA